MTKTMLEMDCCCALISEKVVLLDIMNQMVQKLGFIMRQPPSWQHFWWPSWISQLAHY